jgi:two-component system chemotaxis response regulator CheY
MKTVLIVDDATFMRVSLRKMLEKLNYTIVGEAENGIQAIAKYKEFNPDIVTMDITMPEMDGITAIKEIKKISPTATIVVISAMGQEAYIREAIISGAKDYIIKPFKVETVAEKFSKL